MSKNSLPTSSDSMFMQIAHINLARGYRGGERQTELLIRGLAERGVRQVLVARKGSPIVERLSGADVEIRACSSNLLAAFRATHGVDLVHSHDGRGVYAAWARSLGSSIPYIITRRVNNPLGTGFVTRSAYVRAEFVACVSSDIANIVQRYDRRVRTCVIRSSSSGLSVDDDTSRAIRDSFAGKWLIGNVGALDNAQKGQEYIIEIARRFQDTQPELQFLLIGGGDDDAMLRDMGRDLKNLTFTGFVDNVGDYLAALDLFILPSNKEGIGGILLDAMDQALPIVATRVGGLPEIVTNGQNGLLIDPRSPEQLQEAILRLYSDRGLCSRLGERGREFARDFSAQVMCETYLQLYEQSRGSIQQRKAGPATRNRRGGSAPDDGDGNLHHDGVRSEDRK